MRAVPIIQSLAVVALLAMPALASAAPDQNSNNNQTGCGYYNSNRQWVSTPCNNGPNGQWNNGQNGQWNNGQNGQWNNGRGRDRDDRDDRDDNGNGRWNGNGNHYGWGRGNNRGNRTNQLIGNVASFSPYNLYLTNGTHVELHNGTVIAPRGINLVPGQRVVVRGSWNNDRTYNANEVEVLNINNNNGYNGYNNYNPYYPH